MPRLREAGTLGGGSTGAAVLTGAGSEEGTRALPVCAVGVGAWAAGAFA